LSTLSPVFKNFTNVKQRMHLSPFRPNAKRIFVESG
jgi:hypothetical protein